MFWFWAAGVLALCVLSLLGWAFALSLDSERATSFGRSVGTAMLPTPRSLNIVVIVTLGEAVGAEPSANGRVVVKVTLPETISSTVGAATTCVVVE